MAQHDPSGARRRIRWTMTTLSACLIAGGLLAAATFAPRGQRPAAAAAAAAAPAPAISPSAMLVRALVGEAIAARPPATRPSNGWDPAPFAYDRPATLEVEETTPTPAQVDWRGRPPAMPKDQPAPRADDDDDDRAAPRIVADLSVVRLRFRDADGADVPVLLSLPKQGKGPFPVAVALHGIGSNKAQVTAQVGPALVRRGFAVLAPDLPLHGERGGDPRAMFDQRDLKAFLARMRQAVVDVRQCVDLAEARPELDAQRGIYLVGYSMGAILSSVIGPADERVQGMVLMVGGTVEFPRAAALLPGVAAIQPQLAIAHFAPRPVLMLNGEQDRIIPREMGLRLFNAAAEPKKQVWYDCGHFLSQQAIDDGADFLAELWKARNDAQARK